MWCYDASTIGALVWVKGLPYATDPSRLTENPLLGVIVQTLDSGEWVVMFKYSEQEESLPCDLCNTSQLEYRTL